jgi:hypothetical protein
MPATSSCGPALRERTRSPSAPSARATDAPGAQADRDVIANPEPTLRFALIRCIERDAEVLIPEFERLSEAEHELAGPG